jgi:hypothetical protein
VGQEHLPQIDLCIPVIEDSAAAQDQEIQFLDLWRDLLSGQRPNRDSVLDLVSGKGVRRIPGEDGDVSGHGGSQLAQDPVQDRLVA